MGRLFEGDIERLLDLCPPITDRLGRGGGACIDFGVMARRQVLDAGEKRPLPPVGQAEPQVVIKRLRVAGPPDARQFQKCIGFRGEDQITGPLSPEKRFDPEGVAGQGDAPRFGIQKCEGEHARQARQGIRHAPMDQRL